MANWNKPVSLKDLAPGFLIIDWDKIKTDEQYKALDQIWEPKKPGDMVHQQEEPDDTNAYARGGMVKHGSSTRVSCKRK